METTYTISILVNNKPGVLMRLAQTFARRGYNVDSLVVSPSHEPAFSRMTVVVSGEPDTFDQILRQLNKLVDVVHAVHHQSDNAVERELALFKVKAESDRRAEVFQILEVFRAKTIDITENSLVVEVTGSSSKIDAIEKLFGTLGILEMVRSGKLIMARGTDKT
ncbi:MAG: acetolactate synthase small subunit [SAR324 cluster bacterium]|nr:acetolactate synthase small subunit [SAR324 cluster bacterium]